MVAAEVVRNGSDLGYILKSKLTDFADQLDTG